MAEFGQLKIIQYQRGEREKWLAIEESIYKGLVDDYSRMNNWQVVIKEAEPKLRIIKSKMKPADYEEMDYRAEQAGKRFLAYVGNVVPEDAPPVFRRKIIMPGDDDFNGGFCGSRIH
jgi:hypothetical protein